MTDLVDIIKKAADKAKYFDEHGGDNDIKLRGAIEFARRLEDGNYPAEAAYNTLTFELTSPAATGMYRNDPLTAAEIAECMALHAQRADGADIVETLHSIAAKINEIAAAHERERIRKAA